MHLLVAYVLMSIYHGKRIFGQKDSRLWDAGGASKLDHFDSTQVASIVQEETADAYVVVYSVEDHQSFEGAVDRLYALRQDDTRSVASILVANKFDLVRNRVVQEDGKLLCMCFTHIL